MITCGCGPRKPLAASSDVIAKLTQDTRLSEEEVGALYARFRRIAPDGMMDFDQFRRTMGMLGLTPDDFLPQRMFSVFDSNQDGYLDYQEFISHVAIMLRGTEDEKLELSFRLTNISGSDHITLPEFKELIHACNHMRRSLGAGTYEELDDHQIEHMFNELATVCLEGEMVISLKDFKHGVHSHLGFLELLGLAPRAIMANRSEVMPGVSRVMVTKVRAQLDEFRDVIGRLIEEPEGEADVATESSNDDDRWWLPPANRLPMGGNSKRSVEKPENLANMQHTVDRLMLALDSVDHPDSPDTRMDLTFEDLSSTESPRSIGQRPNSPRFLHSHSRSEPQVHRTPMPKKSEGHTLHVHSSVDIRRSTHRRVPILGPKKGLAVHFGHENWNMVLNMMVGIRMSIGRANQEMARPVQDYDFLMKEKFSIIPRIANIFDSVSSRKIIVTSFIDYAPMVFRELRSSFGISTDEYLRSVGPEQLLGNMMLGNLSSLSELSSEGKSGAFFYYTADGKFMMKTVTKSEHRALRGMLRDYHNHLTMHHGTLIVRFFGLHCLRVKSNSSFGVGKRSAEKLYFVVMGNMFNGPVEVHRRYDLKGSWVKRSTPEDLHIDPSIALKDNDFTSREENIYVSPEVKDKLLRQIELDAYFLRDHGVLDYSLLLGMHDVDASEARMFETSRDLSQPIHQQVLGGMLSADCCSLYSFGIIDILTTYNAKKRAEHLVKSVMFFSQRDGVSCTNPHAYADRFVQFFRKYIVTKR